MPRRARDRHRATQASKQTTPMQAGEPNAIKASARGQGAEGKRASPGQRRQASKQARRDIASAPRPTVRAGQPKPWERASAGSCRRPRRASEGFASPPLPLPLLSLSFSLSGPSRTFIHIYIPASYSLAYIYISKLRTRTHK